MTDTPADVPKVVVADDEPGVRALFVAGLQAAGYQVLEAVDGVVAWALVRAHRPAVVVTDATMPGRSGPELVRAIRADPCLASTYVIIVSGAADPADVAAIRSCGADRYLPKPFSPQSLTQAVAEGLAAAAP